MATPIDTAGPNMARVYDALLGGKDNYPADRDLAARLCDPAAGGYEGLPILVRANRTFIGRAVRWAAQQGVSQFADLGCGLPAARPAVHETARAVDPLARVAYVDHDPVVLSHLRAMPGTGDGLAAVDADLTDPAATLAHPALRTVIDLRKPVCLIVALVLHFLPADRAREVAAGYARLVAPGSCLVITTGRNDDPELWEQVRQAYTAAPLYNHTPAEVASFFGGLEMIPPGMGPVAGMRPGWRDARQAPPGPAYVLGGIGRKPVHRS